VHEVNSRKSRFQNLSYRSESCLSSSLSHQSTNMEGEKEELMLTRRRHSLISR